MAKQSMSFIEAWKRDEQDKWLIDQCRAKGLILVVGYRNIYAFNSANGEYHFILDFEKDTIALQDINGNLIEFYPIKESYTNAEIQFNRAYEHLQKLVNGDNTHTKITY